MENGSKIYEIYKESMPFNKAAVFSDGTASYRIPPEPMPYESVKIRIRTAHQKISEVLLCAGEKRFSMTVGKTTECFDFYETDLYLANEPAPYYFMIRFGDEEYYYTRAGVDTVHHAEYDFEIVPGYTIPDWAKGAVFYQIFVDRFCNGDTSNDVQDGEYNYIGEPTLGIVDWNRYPSSMDVRAFYGGDLAGVMRKLDYLQELGVEVIYLNPIFVSPSNHKYDIQDYDYIDPHYGVILKDEGTRLPEGEKSNKKATKYISRVTSKENLEASNAFFISLVEEIHRRGMKVILDGVFNHCGSFNKWLDREGIYEEAEGYEKGAYVSEDSPYHTFFQFHKTESKEWPYNASYDGWWGHDTLPKLNYEASPKLFNYIMRIARKWVSPPYNVDGWRLDVAADLGHSPEYNHYFWKEFYKTVKQANPNAVVLAEHYGNPREWLNGKEWDSIMNYDAFMEPVTWFLTGMQKHSDDFREDMLGNADSFWDSMHYNGANMAMPSLYMAMNELSNHDHSRFLTRTNHFVGRTNSHGPEAANNNVNKAVLREAVVIQMTWPGAPTVYYGDEAGVTGFTDPDNRRTYPWGREDKELIRFHKDMIAIHKKNREFLIGSLKYMEGEHNVIGYGRFNKEEQSAILINNNDYEITKELSVWYLGTPKTGTMKRLILTTWEGYTTEEAEYPIVSGRVKVTMPPTSAIVLKHRAEGEKKFLHFQ